MKHPQLDDIILTYAQREANRPANAAGGDRKATIGHLHVMAAHDPFLHRALLDAGIAKLAKMAVNEWDGKEARPGPL